MGGYSAGLPIINSSGGGSVIDLSDSVWSEFNEVLSVATTIPTVIVTYIVTDTITQLMNVEFGGSNIAVYTLYINDTSKAKHYTYFGDSLNGYWDFRALDNGLLLQESDVVKITVQHFRPYVGDFYGRMNFLLISN